MGFFNELRIKVQSLSLHILYRPWQEHLLESKKKGLSSSLKIAFQYRHHTTHEYNFLATQFYRAKPISSFCFSGAGLIGQIRRRTVPAIRLELNAWFRRFSHPLVSLDGKSLDESSKIGVINQSYFVQVNRNEFFLNPVHLGQESLWFMTPTFEPSSKLFLSAS